MNNQLQYNFITKEGNKVEIIAHGKFEANRRLLKLGIKNAKFVNATNPPMQEKRALKEFYEYAWEHRPDPRPGRWVGTRLESSIKPTKTTSYKPLNK